MTERSSDPQYEPSSSGRAAAGSRTGILVQAVALAGVVTLTVLITLWISRDSSRPGIEVHIPGPAPVTFQVAGEVMRPGVYSLDGDPRINDAIDAAGGLTANADDSRINLALRVRDGTKLMIPTLGLTTIGAGRAEVTAPGVDPLGGAAPGDEIVSPDSQEPDSVALAGMIDLNTATKDQLVALPGIGDVRAESIIEWRTNNLISSVDDLLAISGIGPATVDSIRNRVIQP